MLTVPREELLVEASLQPITQKMATITPTSPALLY